MARKTITKIKRNPNKKVHSLGFLKIKIKDMYINMISEGKKIK